MAGFEVVVTEGLGASGNQFEGRGNSVTFFRRGLIRIEKRAQVGKGRTQIR